MSTPLSSLRPRSSGGPKIEQLREAPGLNPSVSPVATYDEKRPDRVEYYGGGRSKWDILAASLSGLNPELKKMLIIKNQRWSEEWDARGWEAMDRNQMDWNEFVKANPEYVGLNPHFERGYKAAELTRSAQNLRTALQDHYTTSGLINETNPEKVREGIQNFNREWIAANVQEGNYDPDIYVKHFGEAAQAAEGAIMGRHTQDRAEAHKAQAADKFGQLFANTIDTALHDTVDAAHPETLSASLDSVARQLEAQMQEAEDTGSPRADVINWMQRSLLNLAEAEGYEGRGEAILALADRIKTGTGTLGGRPEFKAAVTAQHKQWENERRAKRSEAMQMYSHNKTVARDNAIRTIGQALLMGEEAGQPIPGTAELMKLPGISPEHFDVANAMRNAAYDSRQHKVIEDEDNQVDYAEDVNRCATGQATYADMPGFVRKYGEARAGRMFGLLTNAAEGKDPVANALRSDGFLMASDMVKEGIYSFGVSTGDTGPNGKNSRNVVDRIIEAQTALRDEVEHYITNEISKGRTVSGASINKFARDTAHEILKDKRYRDFGTNWGVRTPEEILKRATSPEFWSTNEVKVLPDADTATALIKAYTLNKAVTATDTQNKYGLTPEQLAPFIENQAKLYGLDVRDIQERILRPGIAAAKDAAAAKQAEIEDRKELKYSEGSYAF